MSDIVERLASLTPCQIEALATLPVPRAADPMRWQAARSYSSIWRKSAKHRDALVFLEGQGIVERQVSRGETLWRLTKPLGLSIATALKGTPSQ